jgi:hypothetical protein
MHIAILGWGSLLWDEKPDFDNHRSQWDFDGPELKIEFSRVSRTRGGALTLVIDSVHGSSCSVAHARSKRRDPNDAICDLRSREGTTRANIGIYFADGTLNQTKDQDALAAISKWAKNKAIDVVVWTDLPSNFQKVCGSTFCIAGAVAHIQALDESVKSGAAEYVWRAPGFVNTPLRAALQTEPWFKP